MCKLSRIYAWELEKIQNSPYPPFNISIFSSTATSNIPRKHARDLIINDFTNFQVNSVIHWDLNRL